MHDIRWIRENAAAFDEGLASRGLPPEAGRLIALDDERRAAIAAVQAAQERRNALRRRSARPRAARTKRARQELMAEVAGLRETIIDGEADERAATAELNDALAEIPNLPLADVPVGEDERGNVEVSAPWRAARR